MGFSNLAKGHKPYFGESIPEFLLQVITGDTYSIKADVKGALQLQKADYRGYGSIDITLWGAIKNIEELEGGYDSGDKKEVTNGSPQGPEFELWTITLHQILAVETFD